MKRLLYLVFLAILASAPVYAHGGGHFGGGSHFSGGGHFAGGGRFAGGHGGYGHGWRRGGGWYWGGGWIDPVLIDGEIAYDLADPYQMYEQLYAQPVPVYSQPVQGNAPNIVVPSAPSWYFCTASNTYYPYVTSCPSGWKAVSAVPPPYFAGRIKRRSDTLTKNRRTRFV